MKKIHFLLIASLFLFGIIGSVNAALVQYDTDIIQDSNTGLLWWQDLSDFSGQNYATQLATIALLPGGGWSLASDSEMQSLWENSGAEIVAAFTPSGISSGSPTTYWYSGRYEKVPEPGFHSLRRMYVVNGAITQISDWKISDTGFHSDRGAWAAKVVPIPGAVWILGSGLIGLVVMRRKFRK